MIGELILPFFGGYMVYYAIGLFALNIAVLIFSEVKIAMILNLFIYLPLFGRIFGWW